MKTNDYLLSKYVNILTKIYNDHTVDDIISRWNEPHRYYHNINHLFFILNKIDNYFILEENEHLYMTDTYKNFIVAAFFHDIIYNPKSNNNEDKSIEYFLEVTNKDVHKLSSFYLNSIPVVVGMINCTKERKLPTDKFENLFWLFDNDILFNGTNADLMDYENKIFKEFQFAGYDDYKTKRLEFIYNEMKYFESVGIDTNLSYLIPYIKNRKIKVGIYSGTFDHFHLGHMDVLQKASLVFDKVIVAYGNNPEKGVRTIGIPTALNYFQVDTFGGLVTDYISSIENKNVDVTLVRGLRNGADLDYEANQLAFIKDIKPSVKVVYIPCDKKYEHISSSAIQNLEKFDKELANKYLVK